MLFRASWKAASIPAPVCRPNNMSGSSQSDLTQETLDVLNCNVRYLVEPVRRTKKGLAQYLKVDHFKYRAGNSRQSSALQIRKPKDVRGHASAKSSPTSGLSTSCGGGGL